MLCATKVMSKSVLTSDATVTTVQSLRLLQPALRFANQRGHSVVCPKRFLIKALPPWPYKPRRQKTVDISIRLIAFAARRGGLSQQENGLIGPLAQITKGSSFPSNRQSFCAKPFHRARRPTKPKLCGANLATSFVRPYQIEARPRQLSNFTARHGRGP